MIEQRIQCALSLKITNAHSSAAVTVWIQLAPQLGDSQVEQLSTALVDSVPLCPLPLHTAKQHHCSRPAAGRQGDRGARGPSGSPRQSGTDGRQGPIGQLGNTDNGMTAVAGWAAAWTRP